MRRYETIFIAKADLTPEDLKALTEKVQGIINQAGGQITKFDEWGIRRLAYEVRRQTRGFYCFIEYGAGEALIKELERNLKIDDRVIRYLTIMAEDIFHPESIQATSEELKQEPAAPANLEQTEVKE